MDHARRGHQHERQAEAALAAQEFLRQGCVEPQDVLRSGQPHRQRFVAAADSLVRVPAGIDADTACWMLLAVTTQLGVRRVQLELGESVGVVGLGLLGQLVVQYLALAGARHVPGLQVR